jgi:hypothetical protein
MNTSSSTYGPAYSPVLDGERIQKQHEVIRDFMLAGVAPAHGGWYTLAELHAKLSYPEASISAQLRHLRKERFGAYRVEKRRRNDSQWEYALFEPAPKGQMKLL